MAIVKIQADKNLDWNEACIFVSNLIDTNSKAFNERVDAEAERRYKSRHMKELNKARETIEKKVREYIIKNEDHFRVPCKICGEFMYFSNFDENWESKVKPILYGAFAERGWGHIKCLKEKGLL